MKHYYLVAMTLLLCVKAIAQDQAVQATSFTQAVYVQPIPALSSMDNIIAADGFEHIAPPKRRGTNTFIEGKGLPAGLDPLAQQQLDAPKMSGQPLLTSFGAHQGTVLNDPTGAIGPNHYVYAFNSGFGILDRAGNVLLPEASLGTIFPEETLGDPVVLYDRYADRFIIMQFSNSPNGFLVAVGQGPDPINDGWYTYRFNTGSFPDYEKMSIWSDGYYITANKDQSNPAASEVVYALQRDQMLAGSPSAQMIGFPLPGISNSGFYSPGGFNIVGPNLPPAGVPHPIAYLQDDSWAGVSSDHLKVWNVSVDWNTPTNSSISSPQQISTAPFDSVFDGGSFQNLDEPGGGSDIDAIQATMMYMTNYRRFGSHNSAVMNFVVDVSGTDTVAGIRWYELRQTSDGAPWTIYQEGTYVNPEGHSAFCGSIGMDAAGNIGLGYTIVSPTVYTSLRFTGRQASDPLGLMTMAEQVIVDGDRPTAYRSDGRYGDYSHLTVDPIDDMTFWYIAEYMKGASNTRKSHVAAFKIDGGPSDTEAPSTPADLAASNETAVSVELNWTESTDNTAVVGYNIYQDDVNIGTTGTPGYTVNDLAPNTDYSFYVKAKDAVGNESDASNTVTATTTEATACSGGIYNYPYAESFENTFGAWSQSTADDLNWRLRSGGTPSNNTGPGGAQQGSYYIYVEASGNGTGYPNKQAILNSPCFELTDATSANLSFNVHQYGSSNMGSIALEVSDNDGISWETLWSQTGNQGNSWNEVSLNLLEFVGTNIQFRFNRITGGTWQADIAIDNFNLNMGTGAPDTEAPTAPTDLVAINTTASSTDLSWNPSTDNQEVTQYNIYQDGSFLNSTTDTNYTATGLLADTVYTFFVIAEDAAGNESDPSNTVEIETEDSIGPEVIVDGFFEAGWDGWIDGGSDSYRYSGARSYEGSYSIRIRDNTNSSTLTFQNLDLTPYNTVEVDFYFFPNSMENGEDFWLQYNDGSGWQTVATYTRGVDFNNNSFYSSTVTLTAGQYNLTGNAKFRFRNDASANNDRVYIDAITISGNNARTPILNDPRPIYIGPARAQELETYALSEDDEDLFSIYPNPATTVLNVETFEAPISEIYIFSALGMQVRRMEKLESGNTINISELAAGTYFLRFVSEDELITRKFIKE